MWSSDGVSWQLSSTFPSGGSYDKLAWSPDAGAGGVPGTKGLLVAVGDGVAGYSYNGKDWFDMTTVPPANRNFGISWAPILRRFIATSTSGSGAMTLEPRCFPVQGLWTSFLFLFFVCVLILSIPLQLSSPAFRLPSPWRVHLWPLSLCFATMG